MSHSRSRDDRAIISDPTTPPTLAQIYEAQARWAERTFRDRAALLRKFRGLLAEHGPELAATAAAVSERPLAEKLVSEVLPLAEATRWLERKAARVLAPVRYGWRGRPLWLWGSSFEIRRQPHGVVLVIGPGNYPLFLPAVHALHALAAGNAVLLKPAPNTREVALAFVDLLWSAGLEKPLLTVLPDSAVAARDAIAYGVDKVVFTGSSEVGRTVLAQLSHTNTPAIMELSGEDVVIVLRDADLDLVVRALRFGARLNDGRTCMAPRRLIVAAEIAGELKERLIAASAPALRTETFVELDEAIRHANRADHGLGASIFTRDVHVGRQLAEQIRSGFVLINDLIVPTADARFPFGGIKGSGFGTTRGEDGLLQMTFPHVVAVRRGSFRPHFDEPKGNDATLFSAYLRSAHGAWNLRNAAALVRALLQHGRGGS